MRKPAPFSSARDCPGGLFRTQVAKVVTLRSTAGRTIVVTVAVRASVTLDCRPWRLAVLVMTELGGCTTRPETVTVTVAFVPSV